MTRYAQPVSPGPILACLVNERLANVENYRVNHPDILRGRVDGISKPQAVTGIERPESVIYGGSAIRAG